MDYIYYVCYYWALFLVPFVVCALLFGKNDIADWFYLIKHYVAKKEVAKYQQKHKRRVKMIGSDSEFDLSLATTKHTHSQCFYGVDQKGNSLSIHVCIGADNIAEASLVLRLKDGNTYTLPGQNMLIITNLPKNQWKVNGLEIEVLEPFRRMRITFNGLLRNISHAEQDKMEHVKFNFIFNSAASPFYIPHDMDKSLLAEALSSELWRDGFWKDNLIDQTGYYQFGALKGCVKGDAYATDLLLNLPTCRSKFHGIGDKFLLNRRMMLFIADCYGNLINIVIKSFANGCSQINYGCAYLGDNTLRTIKGIDIKLKNIAENKSWPEVITLHVDVKVKTFKVVLHLMVSNISKCTNDTIHGYDCFSIPAECEVNTNQGCAIVEFWYRKKGRGIYIPGQRLCEKQHSLSQAFVTDIKSDESQTLSLAGGKGTSLALLASLKSNEFIVPDGFIVTVNAYKAHLLKNPDLYKSILNINDIACGNIEGKLEESCINIVNEFKKSQLHQVIKDVIIQQLEKYDHDVTEGWAVRSSAIGEDSEELSAAGQNETILGCQNTEEVLDSIVACWASLFAYQSVQYRWNHGYPIAADMAVVVQKMVPANSAGVLFTCHPSTSNPSQMVITSNFGLGETVVSGESDPDTFIVSRTWNDKVTLLDSQMGIKNKVLRMADSGIEESINKKNESSWSLTEKQVLELAKIGIYLERAFGNPRDIEWAFYKEKLYLLQSRPITTLNNWTDMELSHETDSALLTEKSVLTVANVREVIPYGITVLSQTSSVQCLERAMQIHAQENYDPMSVKSLIYFQHNVLIDVVNTIHRNATSKVQVSSLILDLAVFGHPVLDEKINDIIINRRGATKKFDQLKQGLRLFKESMKNSQLLKNTIENVKTLDLDIKKSDPILIGYDKINKALDDIMQVCVCHSRCSGTSVFYQVIAMNVLLEGKNELTIDHYSDFALILSSCIDVISAEIPTYMENIASVIRTVDYTEFCEIKPEYGVEWLRDKCPEAYSMLKVFLEKHGHRAIGELDIQEQSWDENPSQVIQMLQTIVKHEKIHAKQSESINEVISKLKSPKSPITRAILKYIIKKIRVAVGVREQSKSELVRAITKLSKAYRKLADRMVSEGLIPDNKLIYHLTHYEIGQILQARCPLLVTKAIRRQRLYTKFRDMKFAEIIYGPPQSEDDRDTIPDNVTEVCKGTPVCTGLVKARACVINSIDEIELLERGDILITYSTDIGWSPYFPMIAGLVTELGGLVSHGAVVAREYGLPCLVGVKNATKHFKTGDILLLNSNIGEIGKV